MSIIEVFLRTLSALQRPAVGIPANSPRVAVAASFSTSGMDREDEKFSDKSIAVDAAVGDLPSSPRSHAQKQSSVDDTSPSLLTDV